MHNTRHWWPIFFCRRCSSYPVIGLDCEWTPCHRKKQKPDVALLQIATRDGFCVLFRTCFMKVVPSQLLVSNWGFACTRKLTDHSGSVLLSFQKLLADRKVIKVGVGIFHDGLYLRDKFSQVRVNCRLDLRHLSRYCNIYSKKESLAALTAALLPFELQKKNVLSYKWENDLSDEMVLYAALDALAAVLIFDKLLPLLHEQVWSLKVPSSLPWWYF